MVKLNITLELKDDLEVSQFRTWLESHIEVLDFTILPDTQELYENNEQFRLLVKAEKKAKNDKRKFINEKN